MAYLNTKNMCFFQGRIAKVNISTKNGNNGAYKNARFSVAVDRNLSKEERARAKTDSSIKKDISRIFQTKISRTCKYKILSNPTCNM